jgi:heat shock protein HtpX
MNFNSLKNNLKVTALLSVLTALFMGGGLLIAGRSGLIIGFLLAGLLNFGSYWFSDRIVLKLYKAEPLEDPEIEKTVERIAQEAGIPTPDLYRADMPVPNAFATGRNPDKGVVCVTDELLEMLDDSELEGVLAHEIAHIKNRDTLINSVTATIAGAISILAEMAFWGAMFSGRGEEGADLISSAAFMVITPLIATIIRMAISRSMEYRADSSAVKMTGNKQGLKSALQKISGSQRNFRHTKRQEAGANLFIENPFSKKATRLFSTHPPLEKRVKNIDSTKA